jgi:hypothetical protein
MTKPTAKYNNLGDIKSKVTARLIGTVVESNDIIPQAGIGINIGK